MMIEDQTGSHMYFIATDFLGSICGLMDANGNMVEEYSFDACSVKSGFWKRSATETEIEPITLWREGNRRNPNDWALPETRTTFIIDRGYTGHEKLTQFGLINMLSEAKSSNEVAAGNGRVYDPAVGRFLSPDPVVQTEGGSQSMNAYSYALNNPLVYTDPSGENPVFIILGVMVATGYTGGIIGSNISTGKPVIAPWNWDGTAWKYAAMGAMIGGGIAAGTIGAFGFAPEMTKGLNVLNNALLTSDLDIASSLLAKDDIDETWRNAWTGFIAGGIGGLFAPTGSKGKPSHEGTATSWLGKRRYNVGHRSIFDFSRYNPLPWTFRDLRKVNTITGMIKGGLDRYTRTNNVKDALFGIGEGFAISRLSTNRYLNRYVLGYSASSWLTNQQVLNQNIGSTFYHIANRSISYMATKEPGIGYTAWYYTGGAGVLDILTSAIFNWPNTFIYHFENYQSGYNNMDYLMPPF